MTAPRFVVIGCPRSGTKHTAETLRSVLGVDKVGHEGYYNPWGVAPEDGPLLGDVSWMALPELEQWGNRGLRVAHIIRNPVDSITSMFSIGFFESMDIQDPRQTYLAFAFSHCEEIRPYVNVMALSAAVEFWVAWNKRCAQIARASIQVETPDGQFLGALGSALEFNLMRATRASRTTNTRASDSPLLDEQHRKQLEELIWLQLDGRAEQFGYEHPWRD